MGMEVGASSPEPGQRAGHVAPSSWKPTRLWEFWMNPHSLVVKGWEGSRCPNARVFVDCGHRVLGVDTAGQGARGSPTRRLSSESSHKGQSIGVATKARAPPSAP